MKKKIFLISFIIILILNVSAMSELEKHIEQKVPVEPFSKSCINGRYYYYPNNVNIELLNSFNSIEASLKYAMKTIGINILDKNISIVFYNKSAMKNNSFSTPIEKLINDGLKLAFYMGAAYPKGGFYWGYEYPAIYVSASLNDTRLIEVVLHEYIHALLAQEDTLMANPFERSLDWVRTEVFARIICYWPRACIGKPLRSTDFYLDEEALQKYEYKIDTVAQEKKEEWKRFVKIKKIIMRSVIGQHLPHIEWYARYYMIGNLLIKKYGAERVLTYFQSLLYDKDQFFHNYKKHFGNSFIDDLVEFQDFL